MEAFKDECARIIGGLVQEKFGTTVERVVVEYPPSRGMGDLATPVAFELAKRLKRPPRLLAQELASAFPRPAWLQRVEAGGAGYLNMYLDRGAAVRALAQEIVLRAPAPEGASIIVEHTNINPNKAAHIGHLRNAVLGDSLARMLRFLGHRVEVQNYIDDTGVQVADVVVGFQVLEKIGLEGARTIAASTRFDYYC